MKKYIIISVAITFITLLTIIGYSISTHNNTQSQYKWSVKIYDIDTHKEIKEAKIAIAELDKTFVISEGNNIISHPMLRYRPPYKTNTYPYGYTLITYAKGYYPRIDHNVPGGAIITLELTKVETFTNQTYTEYFSGSPRGEIGEFIHHYFGNAPFEE